MVLWNLSSHAKKFYTESIIKNAVSESSLVNKTRRFLNNNRHKIALYSLFLIYFVSSILWFLASVLKLDSFHAFVYDLGSQVSSLNSIAQTRSILALLTLVPSSKPFVLPLSYITYLYNGPIVFLGIQSFGVLLASIFIYLLLLRRTGSETLSMISAFSFIFFFPLSWYMFFDFHIAGFFGSFFFAGMYFMKQRPKLSFALFLLAASTSIVLAFFLFLYLFILIFKKSSAMHKENKNFPFTAHVRNFAFLIAPALTIIFAIYHYHAGGILSAGNGTSTASGSIIQLYLSNLSAAFNNGFIVLFMMLILLIVIITLIAKKSDLVYLIAVLPILLFVLLGGYPFWNFKVQYGGEFFTPILFFLLVVGQPRNNSEARSKPNVSVNIPTETVKRGIILFVILVILMGIFYNPYGPLNFPDLPGDNAYADFYHQINVTSSDAVANEFVNLVPSRDTVLVQDNEPQFSDRPRNFLFGPGNLPWLNTSFYDKGPKPASVIPQFMAVDVNDYEYGQGWLNFPFYNSSDGSMATWFPYFYSHYNYGLLAYSYPFYLYEINYSGVPVISSGMNFIGSSYVDHESSSALYEFNGSLNNRTLLNTLYKVYLLPGSYKFSFGFMAENLSGDMSLKVSNGVTSFTSPFSLNEVSGYVNNTMNFTVISPSDYTFSAISTGLTGHITRYNREHLGISNNKPKIFNLTLSNPSSTVSSSFPLMLNITASQVGNFNDSEWNNLAFYYEGNPVHSWLMSVNDNGAQYWIRAPSVPAHEAKNIQIIVFSNNTDIMNGISVGEAPQLSATYAELDNGAAVFGPSTGNSGYYNFAGTSLNGFARVISGGYGLLGGVVKVNNGLYIIGNTNATTDFEAVGTGAQISNSVIMGWGFANTNTSTGDRLDLNGPDLGGYTNNIEVGNRTTPTYLLTGNTSYTATKLVNFPIENQNSVVMSYGTNSTVSVYADGKSYYVSTPNYAFTNWVGAGISYSSPTKSQSVSPEIYYFFVLPINSGYVHLNYNVN